MEGDLRVWCVEQGKTGAIPALSRNCEAVARSDVWLSRSQGTCLRHSLKAVERTGAGRRASRVPWPHGSPSVPSGRGDCCVGEG